MQNEVLNEYRRGDADKRIAMYLFYREFRDRFSCIEQDDPTELDTLQLESSPRRLLSAMRRVVKNHPWYGYFFSS